MKYQFVLFIMIMLLGLGLGCNQNQNKVSHSDTDRFGGIVAGYMPSSIEATDAIRVRFARAIVQKDEVGHAVRENIFTLKPYIDGDAVWEDAYTFRFSPRPHFNAMTDYTLSFNQKEVLKDQDLEMNSLDFQFSILPVKMNIDFGKLEPSEVPGVHRLSGELSAVIPLPVEEVERMLAIEYPVSKTNISWEHSNHLKSHRFIVEGIKRGAKQEALLIKWDAKKLKSDLKGQRNLTIPARDEFKVVAFDVSQSGGKEIVVYFSDNLQQEQIMQGLVRIPNYDQALKTEIRGNQFVIYPGEKLKGNFQVSLDPSIKSQDGKLLGETNRFNLSFEDIKPQLRLLGRGVIVPNSEDVIFPFEAVNVTGVTIEMFEIFESNVMQFLQYQELDRSWDVEPVGRIIAQEKVPLEVNESDRNNWKRFGLDLSKYTNLSPGSIYQVRIAFDSGHVLYGCQSEKVPLEKHSTSADALQTIMRYNFDYAGFDYEQAEDPCYPAYYNPERFIQRNVLASNLGITAKSGADETMTVFVHDLRTTEPVSSVDISIYDFQQQLISNSSTNAKGYCEITKTRRPHFVVAEHNGEKGYLKLGDATARPMSDFDVSGVHPTKGMKGFIYTERDVWRPGDTVFLNFILEDEVVENVTHPVTCTLINPKGQRLYTRTRNNPVGPIYPFYFDTEQSDLTGNWRAEVKVGGASFYKMLKVEAIQPNRLKIIVDTEDAIRAYLSKPEIELKSRWLHGAPASNLKAKMEMQLLRDRTTFTGYTGYTFLDPTRIVDSRVMTIFDDLLNADGQAKVSLENVQNELLPGRMRASFKTRVFEPGGNFSSDQFSQQYHPFEAYAGVKLPTSRWGSKELDIDQINQIDIVTTNPSGDALGLRKVTVGLYHSEWRWWWDRTDRSLAQFNSSVHTGSFFKDTLRTDANGKANIIVKPDAYGMYLIRVCDAKSGHCTGDFYYAGELWDEYEGRNAAVKLVLNSDSEKYQVGDRATITIPSATGSAVLVSLENQDGVIRSERIPATGNTTQFEFEITNEMQPNIYAHVSLIQPHNNGDNDLPMRMYGVLPLLVENIDNKLEPVLQMPDQLKPEQTFTLELEERNDKPMAYTIALVDEGLLDLTRFKTPDPYQYFYAKEALGLRTWDIYDYVLGNYGGQVDRMISVGGDGTAPEVQAVEEVNRFKPVVIQLGPYFLNGGKSATHEITLPNYVGSVRTMVVAAEANRYGQAEKTTAVKQPLMILSTMPRVLSPTATVTLPVHVFAMEDDVKNVTVVLKTNDRVNIVGASEKSIRFDQTGDQVVPFEITVNEYLGPVTLEVEAMGGRHTASSRIDVEILNPNPVISEVTEQTINEGDKWSPELPAIGMDGSEEAILELYSIYPFDLERRLKYLLRYPYGCIEQTTSSAFPQLFVSELVEMTEQQQSRARANVQAAILKLRSFQNPGGGFSYWPGVGHVNAWTNSYAGHFLIEAQSAGYFVDQDLFDHWLKYQQNQARNFEREGGSEIQKYQSLIDQAYRLYTLAKYGAPEFGAMNRLRNVKKLPGTALALLAATYGSAGQTAPAEEMLRSFSANIPTYTSTGRTYGSDMRDRALLVEAFLTLDKRSDAAPVLRRISEDLSKNNWYSTQSTAFALKAISSYINLQPQKGLHFSFTQTDNEKQLVQVEKPIFQIALDANQQGDYQFEVENLGEGELYARMIRRGQPVEPIVQERSSHLKMNINYMTMDGKKLDPLSIQQGTDFIAEVVITNPGTMRNSIEELALQQIFPSGWEIINQRMDQFSDALKSDRFDFQDIRDDRVYTFFDMNDKGQQVYRIGLNAAYVGRYLLPAVQCEAMYDHSISATSPGKWVEVVPGNVGIASTDR